MALNRRQIIELAYAMTERRRTLMDEIRGEVARAGRAVRERRGRHARHRADCGSEIPFERLQAQPDAARCRDCQERHERTYRM